MPPGSSLLAISLWSGAISQFSRGLLASCVEESSAQLFHILNILGHGCASPHQSLWATFFSTLSGRVAEQLGHALLSPSAVCESKVHVYGSIYLFVPLPGSGST